MKVLSDGWTAVTRDGSLSAHFEHTVVVTREGCEILTLLDGGRGRAKQLLATAGSERLTSRFASAGRAPSGRHAQVEGVVRRSCRAGSIRWRSTARSGLRRTSAAGRERNFVRLLVGDRVVVELTPRDLTRGRIVGKL